MVNLDVVSLKLSVFFLFYAVVILVFGVVGIDCVYGVSRIFFYGGLRVRVGRREEICFFSLENVFGK